MRVPSLPWRVEGLRLGTAGFRPSGQATNGPARGPCDLSHKRGVKEPACAREGGHASDDCTRRPRAASARRQRRSYDSAVGGAGSCGDDNEACTNDVADCADRAPDPRRAQVALPYLPAHAGVGEMALQGLPAQAGGLRGSRPSVAHGRPAALGGIAAMPHGAARLLRTRTCGPREARAQDCDHAAGNKSPTRRLLARI